MKWLGWIKKVPGWVWAVVLFFAGGFLGRGWSWTKEAERKAAPPGPTPEEIEEKKKEIREQLVEEETEIDNEWDDEEDEWNETYQ